MFFGPLRLLSLFISAVVIGVPLAAFGIFVVAVAGDPGSCENEDRPIAINDWAAASFQLKWDDLVTALDFGQLSTVDFSESEATSRARLWAEEHDVPVSRLFICFREDGGAISGTVDVPVLPDVDVLVEGTFILDGDHPQSSIDKIEVGGLPSPLTNLVETFINDLIDDQTDEIDLSHSYNITFREGEVTISGVP